MSEVYSDYIGRIDGPLGQVYILKRSSGNTVKVGETSKCAIKRLRDYCRKHGLNEFSLHKVYYVPLDSRKHIEKKAHQLLRKYRIQNLIGSREIFDCGSKIAEWAVKKAIDENEECAKVRLENEAQKLFNNALKEQKSIALDKLRASPWLAQKQYKLEKFIKDNSFEKQKILTPEEKREIILTGIGGMIFGSLLIWLSGYGLPLLFLFGVFCLYYNGNNLFKLGGPQPLVPDHDALELKKKMQNEIISAEMKCSEATENDFRRKYNVNDFYPKPEIKSLTYHYDKVSEKMVGNHDQGAF